MHVLRHIGCLLVALFIAKGAGAEDVAEETFMRFECARATDVMSIEAGIPVAQLTATTNLQRITPAARASLKKRGFYSVQKTSGTLSCAIGRETYRLFISYHEPRERGECAAAEFWSLWIETPSGHQFVYTLDGDVCFPGQPLLKSLRLESKGSMPSMTVCASDDEVSPPTCRNVSLPRKGDWSGT